jgi:hypothetical protein
MKRIASFAHLFLPFLFWACEPDYGNLITSPEDLPPSIFVFLNTAADSQYVIIRNAIPRNIKPRVEQGESDPVLEADFRRFRQAIVALTGAGEDFVFHDKYELKIPYYYDIEREFVFVSTHAMRPGEIYRLRVEIPEKGVFTASTTAPGDFQILAPKSLDTLDVFKLLTIKWTAARGAAGYQVGFRWSYIDSTWFKLGMSDKVDTIRDHRYRYIEQSPNPDAIINHSLTAFYTHPDWKYRTLLEATVFVHALDTPAWLAWGINQRGLVQGGDDEVLTKPGVYSNIAGGRGVMTATTGKIISVILPPQKK